VEVFVARQPIFNEFEQIVGYELLYRNKDENFFPDVNADTATIDVLVNAFLSIGMDEVSEGKPTFINFTTNLLKSVIFDYIDPAKVIVEILEDVELNAEMVVVIQKLKRKGFRIALDDFVLEEKSEEIQAIFQLVDYIKIDFLSTSLLDRMEIENEIKERYPHIKLLAEKVETRNQYDVARHTGYALFQGFFFEQPQILSTTDIPPNVIQYLQIVGLLREDEPDINVLSENIERDISLTYKLLQLINHSSKRSKSKVRSIKQAILLLGLTELRRWMYLLALREAKLDIEKDTTRTIMFSSLLRAKLCEKFAHYNYENNYPEYFLVGLFSLIDALLERPLNTILRQLPFSEEIIDTISGHDTEMTPYLQLVAAINKLEWSKVEALATELDIPMAVVMRFYEEATEWVNKSFD
jgi:c-di-GMP phosphodiesterase